MTTSLAGYMGSGKSRIAKHLSEKTGYPVLDLDQEIVSREQMAIADIFRTKGELYFRRKEREVLQDILATQKDLILSLGGGTPAYYDNIELIRNATRSIYLQASVSTLVGRLLRQKSKRPLIANIHDDDLPEFVAKHLFERMPFYSQCEYLIPTDGLEPEQIVDNIIQKLNL